MKITRRNFVQVFGSAAAMIVSGGGLSSAFGSTSGKSSHLSASSNTLFGMKANDVRRFVGRSFTVTAPDGTKSQLIMTEVNNLARRANEMRGYSGESFSMIFKCRGEERLAQGVYELGAPGIDEVSALIVPTSRRNREYEILVNRVNR